MTDLPVRDDLVDTDTTESEFQSAIGALYDFVAQLVVGCTQEPLTIASGVVVPTKAFFTVDVESGTTDDLTNITQSSIGAKLLIMKVGTAGRTITLKHLSGGSGQIYLTGAADLAMVNTTEMIAFSWNSSSSRWEELWRNFGLSLPGAADLTAAKTLLGLGTAATLASSAIFQVSNNLSEGNAASIRANLGILGMALQAASAVAITGGTIAGITDLAVADGGTGRGTLATHGILIGAGTGAINTAGTGTAGQVMTSNGPSADPTMQDLPDSTIPTTYGAVGTTVLAGYSGSSSIAAGATVNGSTLQPCGISSNISSGETYLTASGAALTGTWRAMGYMPTKNLHEIRATLWVRVS